MGAGDRRRARDGARSPRVRAHRHARRRRLRPRGQRRRAAHARARARRLRPRPAHASSRAPQDFEGVDDDHDDPVRRHGHRHRPRRRDAARGRAVGAAVTDDAGTRRATLLFEPGTDADRQARRRHHGRPAGRAQRARDRVHRRRSRGRARCPASCRRRPAYTYAVEYSVDEADELGAVDVRFDKPVATYTDNFLEFPVGTPVPTGYYDRAQARWIPSAGRPRDRDRRRVGRPRRGRPRRRRRRRPRPRRGRAAPARAALRPGQEPLARRGHPLHAVGLQLALRPAGRRRARPAGRPCTASTATATATPAARSSAARARRSARRSGSPARRTTCATRPTACPGRRSEMTLDIPLTPATPAGAAEARRGRHRDRGPDASIAASRRAPTRPSRSSGTARTPTGARSSAASRATIRLSYVYDLVYRTPATFGPSFAAFGGTPFDRGDHGTRVQGLAGDDARSIGGLPAPPSAIGGWNLDVHQTYDPVGRTLYGGDGTQAQRRRAELRLDPVRDRPAALRRAPDRRARQPGERRAHAGRARC